LISQSYIVRNYNYLTKYLRFDKMPVTLYFGAL
jgi:hypothetical protein